MEKIIERTKFAIAWQKTNEDQEREEQNGQKQSGWKYRYYSYQVPSWMNAWLAECEQTHGLHRLSNVIRILSAHKVYLRTLHIGSRFDADYQKGVLGLLDLFCGTPRSLRLLALFPDKNGITEELSEFCQLYEGDKEHLAAWFSKDMDPFWEELSGYAEMGMKGAVKNVFFLMCYLTPDEILKVMRQEYWRKEIVMTRLDESILFSIYPEKTKDEIAEFYRALLFTPAIRTTHYRSAQHSMAMAITNHPGTAQYFNWILCNKRLREKMSAYSLVDMAATQDAPEAAIGYLERWNVTDETQTARLLHLFAYGGGEPHFLRCLDRFVQGHTQEELDRLLARPLVSILLDLCGRKAFSGAWEAHVPSVSLDDGEFAGTDFITDAIVKNQKAVLRYLTENQLTEETVEYLQEHQEPVRTFTYLNAWSAKDINALAKNDVLHVIARYADDILESGEKYGKLPPYTCQELNTIHKICVNTKECRNELEMFFALLGKMRSETACRRMSQFTKCYTRDLSDAEAKNATAVLMRYDLPTAGNALFRIPVPMELTARAICAPAEAKKAFAEAETETECIFAVENPELCKNGLRDGMRQFLLKDETVQSVKASLELPDEFYDEHNEHVERFFLDGSGQYAKEYLTRSIIASPFKVVLKAAMSGKLPELRYTDLEKECCMRIPGSMIHAWTTDQSSQISNFTVYEDTSFNGIMKMGAVPTRTCMNYIDGMYRECLLAYFDGNKKIVYVKKNSSIIGRAVIRLTKTANRVVDQDSVLKFTDVTEEYDKQEAAEEPVIETPVLFLERCYSGVQGNSRVELEAALIQFVAEKAKEMGCELIIASDYMKGSLSEAGASDFEPDRRFIFITKSKAGDQYLDSFGGVYSNKKYDSHRENVFVKATCYCEQQGEPSASK